MSTDPFAYRGPATIAGVHFSDVVLREQRDGALRGWIGHTRTTADLSAQFLNTPSTTIELPDGTSGTAFLSIEFDGSMWKVDITGTGPAPGSPTKTA